MLFTFITAACLCSSSVLMAHESQDINLCTFENGDEGMWDNTPWFDSGNFVINPTIMENPMKSDLNNSDKCLGTVIKENTGWWGAWTFLQLKEPVLITEDMKYIKMMVYRSENRGGLSLGWNTNDNWFNSVSPRNEGVWEDVVFDIRDKVGEELSVLVLLHYDWNGQNGPQVEYYYDNIVFSSNSLPRGVELTDGTGFEVNFENDAEIQRWISKTEIYSPDINSFEIVENPVKDLTNSSDMVFKFEKGECDWWHGGPEFKLNGLIELNSDLQYLHVAVNVPETAFDENGLCCIQLCAWDHLGNESNENFILFEGDENIWHDLVFDLTSELNYVSSVSVRFDVRKDDADEWVKSPAGTFYIDALAINDDENDRDIIINSVSKETITGAQVYSINNTVNIKVESKSEIEIINISGVSERKLKLESGETGVVNNLNSGIYLFVIKDKYDNKKVCKVIVK